MVLDVWGSPAVGRVPWSIVDIVYYSSHSLFARTDASSQ